jgi:glucose/arabinose dehydrogenase
MRPRHSTLAAIAIVLVIGVIVSVPGRDGLDRGGAAASARGGPALSRTVVLGGLDGPWDMAFLPDGALLFTEKCRGLSVRRADGSVQRLFGASGATVVARDFFCEGQSGAHGVAIDPMFSANRAIYFFMPSRLSSPPTNRVVRLVVDAGSTTVSERTDIVTDIPYKHAVVTVGRPGAHSGGRIRFGPDGFLYITTGDNHHPTLPQDVTRLGGKVLRVDRDGKAAPGNNAPAGGDPRIFTYGHRNVQGIAFRPGTGQPFVSEHGPNHSDEITPLVAGGNAGWDPQKRPGLQCPGGYCGYAGDATSMPMTDTTRFPRAMRPSWTNEGQSEGMGPLTFLSGPQWAAWDGRLAVGLLAGRRVEVLQLDEAGRATGHSGMDLPRHRMRALVQSPDGHLYVAVDEGEIWRVAPGAG